MATTTLEHIGQLLSHVDAPGAFTARRTALADDLCLEVKGIGPLRFPISRAQARRLCDVARPARYGRGEKTLLDKRVRDTWEIPKSRVKIDRRRWNRTLLPMLEKLRADLGLPDGYRLKAALHSMLVYAPGQFFLRHQDSEKVDEMVGTLTVTLPSKFKGGAFVVEHRGEKVTYRASKKPLTFIAFYADCHHEVRPVKEGYRIALTYNLVLEGNRAAVAKTAAESAPEMVDALAKRLREHFETPLPSNRRWEKDAPPRDPPSRLVYLLDHQYTERGLGWNRLKGDDAARAMALQAVAERAGYEVVLALAEVHETWSCEEPWEGPRYGRWRFWERDEEDEWYEDDDPPTPDSPDDYELVELCDWNVTLHRWIDLSGKAEPIVTRVVDEELCSTTPSSDLEPYRAEHEGYMGNYGNTMDRWYRRAAIVLWPRERAFAVRGEASPAWALEVLKQRIRAGSVPEAQEMASSLLPFWETAADNEERSHFFTKALRVAEGLDQPALAASLLKPFRVEALSPGPAPAFVALVKRYGEDWVRSLISEWSGSDRPWTRYHRDLHAWLPSLPRLCKALRKADAVVGTLAARLLLEDRWAGLTEEIVRARGLESPSRRNEALVALARPVLGYLESTTVVEAEDQQDEALTFLCADENETLLPCLVQVLRSIAKSTAPTKRAALGFDVVARHCKRLLEEKLEQPARDENDWSIPFPEGCRCELCSRLATFLSDPETRRLEWPLAKQGRKHVHRRIDAHELPVRHETRRSGSPYTLVLSKENALLEDEARERRRWRVDLEWLTRLATTSR